MKLINNVITIALAGAMLFAGACDPIEDRDMLKNSFNPDDIKLEVVQTTSNGTGNKMTLKMTTPGVIGYWDYLVDTKYSDVVEDVIFPIPGKSTFNYIVSTPYITDGDLSQRKFISVPIEVDVKVIDNPLPQAYYDLTGADIQGKTWVFDKDSGNPFYYMSSPTNYAELWWNAGADAPPADVNGRMVFDLKGAANFTYFANEGGASTAGKFRPNGTFTKLFIAGGLNLLGATSNGSGNNNGEYTIVELTPNRLVLHTGSNDAGTGWVWVLKPAP